MTPAKGFTMPANLKVPTGWSCTDRGICTIDPETRGLHSICRTPIILSRRLKRLETGDEKMEIAYWRDNQWHTAIYPRSTIFSTRGILDLADRGCTVTSENAKHVVRFLAALEAENIDQILLTDATGTFGWQAGDRFLPGHAQDITLDIDPSQRGMAAAYCQCGSMERWVEHMAPHREKDKFRFILAASFAAPLLRIVKQRTFVVHNWGDSRGGKTAALKAALSVWGDPERLMVSFNSTQVGLERVVALYCDLPLGIDERQLAGNRQEDLEKIVYMIASGTGKVRGAKNGGLQTIHQWRTVALATGEEPISTDTSMTGVSTRVLEVCGAPFETEQDAAMMHQQAAADYGWAGPAFIGKILEVGEQKIVDAYDQMQQCVQDVSAGKNGAHIAGISAVALADAMIDVWFFGGTPESSWERAKRMAASILLGQVENNATDVNENAVQFVIDWVISNEAYFVPNVVAGTCLGYITSCKKTVCVLPSMLSQALTKAGYSYRKTAKYMAERGLITTETGQDGKKAYTVRRWYDGRTTRFVELHLDLASQK